MYGKQSVAQRPPQNFSVPSGAKKSQAPSSQTVPSKPSYNPVMGFQGFGAPPAKASRKVQGINKTERMTFAPGRLQPGQVGGAPAPGRGPSPSRGPAPARTNPSSAPKFSAAPGRNPSVADPNAKKLDKAAIYGFQGVGVAPAKSSRMVQGINKTERMTFAPGRLKAPVARGGVVSAKSAPNYKLSGQEDQSRENQPVPSAITYESYNPDQSTENQPVSSSITYESYNPDQSTENQPYDSGISYETYNPDQSTENQPYDSGITYDEYGGDQSTESYGGYEEPAYDQGASGGYEEPAYDQGGYDQGGGYEEPSYDQGGGYEEPSYDQGGGYEEPSYDQGGGYEDYGGEQQTYDDYAEDDWQ